MSEITHIGIIKKIINKNVEIEILDTPDCSSCSLKGACNISQTREKILNITIGKENFNLNETVKIVMSSNIAFKALFWAYLFPFIIIVLSIITLSNFINEGLAGFVSILILLTYYLIIYLNKSYFKTKFNLTIKRI